MGETLSIAPDLTEMEMQFDAEELYAIEQPAFPKLDGVLFPIVVANAEVVAPCQWMDGAEVSLTVALNNYYQLMTEENADEVIADVCEFLARRIGMVENNEKEAEAHIQIAEQTDDELKTNESLVHTLPSIEEETKVAAEESAQTRQRLAEDTISIRTDQPINPAKEVKPPEAEAAVSSINERSDEAHDDTDHHAAVSEDLFDVPQLPKGNTSDMADVEDSPKVDFDSAAPIEALADMIDTPPLSLETDQDFETDYDHPALVADNDTTRQDAPEEDLQDAEVSLPGSDGSGLDTSDEPAETVNEAVDDLRDISAPADEESELIIEEMELPAQDSHTEDREVEDEPAIFDYEDGRRVFDEEYEYIDTYGISETVEADHGVGSAELVKPDKFEPPAQASLANDETGGLLTDLVQPAENGKPEMLESADEPDVGAEVTLVSEVGDDEGIIANEVDTQAEPQDLYVRFPDRTVSMDEPERMGFTMKLQLENDEAVMFGEEDEPGDPAMHRQTKGLPAAVTIKKTLTRAAALGRFALRLHIVSSEGRSSFHFV